MKKIRKESLKLEKEVITQLTQDHLSQVVGGNGTNTFHSQCLCISQNIACESKGETCTLVPATNDATNCNTCNSEVYVCQPVQPEESHKYVCLSPDISENCHFITLP